MPEPTLSADDAIRSSAPSGGRLLGVPAAQTVASSLAALGGIHRKGPSR